MTTTHDDTFLNTFKAGNSYSFRGIVDEFTEKGLNTSSRFLNNRQDAADVAQAVFIEIFLSLAKFRGEATLSTWVYRIAVTKSLDFLRQQKRKKRFGSIKQVFGLKGIEQELPTPVNSNPDALLENQERAQILQKAVNSLAENQKVANVLHKYEGFSYKEIAAIMNTSVSAVESLIHRGMQNLKKKLYHYYDKIL